MSILVTGLRMPKDDERLDIVINSKGKVSNSLDLECRSIGFAMEFHPEPKSLQKELYLVTFEGYLGGWGMRKYVLGIFSDKTLAKDAIDRTIADHGELLREDDFSIFKLPLDGRAGTVYSENMETISSEYYIGGYLE